MQRARRHISTVVLAVALLAVPAVPAAASDGEVVVSGGGWGHAVGMSQYGAYAMALDDGAARGDIFAFYYDGVAEAVLGEALPEPEPLWVNLELELTRVRFATVPIRTDPSPVTLRRGAESIEFAAGTAVEIAFVGSLSDPACTYTVGGVVSDPGDCAIDLEWDGWEEDPTTRLVTDRVWRNGGDGSPCTHLDWNAVPSIERPCSYSRGTMHVRPDNNTPSLNVSVEVALDSYVLGISEMPYYWGLPAEGPNGMEALEAQAVVSRTFALSRQLDRGDPETRPWCWCHVYDTTIDQNYVGWGHSGLGQDQWIDAVRATDGIVLVHEHHAGGPILATYGSSNGGATENVADVWGGEALPYLVSKPDPWSTRPANPYATWTKTLSLASFAATLGFDRIDLVVIRERYASGTPSRIEVRGVADGAPATEEYTGTQFRSWFGLRSQQIAGIVGDFSIVRWWGMDRYETAAAIAAESFPAAGTVFVATGADFPDALVAAPLAAARGGPMLLVLRDGVPTATRTQLERLDPAEIVILGGTGVVSETVAEQLTAYAPTVTRLAGPDRYGTAAAVSAAAFPDGAATVYLATGYDFPDALAGSAVAAAGGAPVLLTRPDRIPNPTRDELTRLAPETVVVLGSGHSVQPAVVATLEAWGHVVVTVEAADRLAGVTAISGHAFPDGADTVYLATSAVFPDALAAGPVAGLEPGPLLLVDPDAIPGPVAAELTRLRPARFVVLGGSGAVSSAVEEALAGYLR